MSRRRDRRSTRHFDDIPPSVPVATPGPSRLREQVTVQQAETSEEPVVENGKLGNDEEEEEGDETWDNFTAEYYEVVEQLPLELHRNFALLQELDDQTQRHTTKLLNLVREYVLARLKPPIPELLRHPFPLPDEVSQTEVDIVSGDTDVVHHESTKGELATRPMDDKPPSSSETPPTSNTQINLGSNDTTQLANTIPNISPKSYLPEIGKIARDLIRGSDEKVGIAVAAYNAVDRHIRAIDSALESQQTNLVMGVRPDTLPSTVIGEHDGGLAKSNHAISGDILGSTEEGEVVIGLGGGGGRKKGRSNKRKRGKEMVVEEGPGGVVDLSAGGAGLNMKIDPNEPRYCYCNNVSYGIMIGCDNDDCPMEWFHLGCVGLTAEPTGHWWCDHCKPLQKKRK